MSSLIFYTDEAQALIVTDTLAVTDNGEPLSLILTRHFRTAFVS